MTEHEEIRMADLCDERDCRWMVQLIDAYARDPMGNAAELSDDVRRRLRRDLPEDPTCRAVLALVDGEPVGIVVAFTGYSTFQARPLLNVHDVYVRPGHRHQGLARRMLAKLESVARQHGFCKLTLEVRYDNEPAKRTYRKLGFTAGQPSYEFWTKPLGS